MQIKVIFKSGFVRDVIPIEGTRISVYDYDIKKYDTNKLEEVDGELCVVKIYFKYPYDENGKTIPKIRYEIIIAVINNKIRVIECPKEVTIAIIKEDN